jgi:hypothetical protein
MPFTQSIHNFIQVNLSGSKGAGTPTQLHHVSNMKLMKMRLTSVEDATTEGEEGNPSPNIKQTTQGMDSLHAQLVKGN